MAKKKAATKAATKKSKPVRAVLVTSKKATTNSKPAKKSKPLDGAAPLNKVIADQAARKPTKKIPGRNTFLALGCNQLENMADYLYESNPEATLTDLANELEEVNEYMGSALEEHGEDCKLSKLR